MTFQTVRRFATNPLITPSASPTLGDNLNGPSVIRAPDWLRNAPGRYLMYFAHHNGAFIRLAHADAPQGPWRIHEPGSLSLEDLAETGFGGHVASPDVHVDEENRRLVMFFHAKRPDWRLEDTPGLRTHFTQATGVAFSYDGLTFEPSSGILGFPYFRVWRHRRFFYALSARGLLFRYPSETWPDGSCPFEERAEPLVQWRHCAVHVRGDRLTVFFSRSQGDAPERILYADTDLSGDWQTWQLSEPRELLRPEGNTEGAHLPVRPSVKGLAREPVHELRDPCVLEDAGKLFLFYSIAGESGISGATLETEEDV